MVEEGTSSHPALIKEEEEEEEKIVEVFDSEDEFDVFNKILSLEAFPGDLSSPSLVQSNPYQEPANTSIDMGIQRK